MRWIGMSLMVLGVGGAIAIEGAAPFVSVPAFIFVVLVSVGVVMFAHGRHSVWKLLQAATGKLIESDRLDALAAAGTARLAFLAAGGIGMLIGIVHALSALDDPSQLGAGVATSLLTVFYGSLFSFLFCMPIERRLSQQTLQA